VEIEIPTKYNVSHYILQPWTSPTSGLKGVYIRKMPENIEEISIDPANYPGYTAFYIIYWMMAD